VTWFLAGSSSFSW